MSLKAMGNKRWVGRHHTEETKKKQSESIRRYFQNKKQKNEQIFAE